MFLLNSRLSLFTATNFRWHSLSRSYGVILPSSLTRVISLILGFSPRLPVSVCGTGTISLLSSFSRQCGFVSFHTCFLSPSRLSLVKQRTSLSLKPNRLDGLYHQPALTILLCHCIVIQLIAVQEYQPVVHRLRLYRPRLRSRLTLGGRAFPRKP